MFYWQSAWTILFENIAMKNEEYIKEILIIVSILFI